MLRRTHLAGALVAATAALSACGGSDPLTDAQLRRQANQACQDLAAKIDAMGEYWETPERLQDAEAEIDEATVDTIDQIADLEGEDGPEQEAVDAFVDAVREAHDASDALHDTLEAEEDPQAMSDARAELHEATVAIGPAAQAAGLDACTEV